MSKIQAELVKATGVEQEKGEDRQEYLSRLVKAVSGLPDAKWNALSDEAADWFNGAADAKNAKKGELPEMPDYEEPKAETSSRRRRGSDEPEKAAASAIDDSVAEDDVVVIKTTRGKVVTGKVVEIKAGKFVAVQVEGEKDDIEFAWDRLEAMTKANNGKAEEEEEAPRRRRGGDDEPEGPAEIKKGDKVVAVTKRGKTIEGTVDSIDDDNVSIDDGKDIWDFERDRLESLLPAGKPAKAEKEDEAPRRRRGGSDADEKPAAKAEKEEPKRASNKGVSVGERIRELILDDLDASVEQISKALKKEGLEFKENTLELNYKEAHKFIALLKARKMLK